MLAYVYKLLALSIVLPKQLPCDGIPTRVSCTVHQRKPGINNSKAMEKRGEINTGFWTTTDNVAEPGGCNEPLLRTDDKADCRPSTMCHTSHAVHLALASGYCANVSCDFKNKNKNYDIFRERLKYEMRRRTLPLAVPPETPMRKGCRITVVLSSGSLRSVSLSPAILAMCRWRSCAGTSL